MQVVRQYHDRLHLKQVSLFDLTESGSCYLDIFGKQWLSPLCQRYGEKIAISFKSITPVGSHV
jgi:hypothetical protein